MTVSRPRGFTLIEMMAVVAIVAIIAAVAVPSYQKHIARSRVPTALDALSSYASRLEQAYQGVGNYGATACTPALPSAANFTISCAVSAAGQGYTATAAGSGSMVGYAYTVDNTGTRKTLAHPDGVPGSSCWSIRGKTCDA